MTFVEHLAARAGQWSGKSRLSDPERNVAEESDSTLTVVPVLGGLFVRVDYTWQYKDRPQEGTMLVGTNPATTTDSICWADTWHMGHIVMTCTGTVRDEPVCAASGSYAAPPGPDWGWRITIDLSIPDTIRLVMHNIWPDGKEEVAVDAAYSRA